MALRIGDTAPDFEAETTQGKIRFHDWLGNSWGIIFSHPKDFTPVCTTELGYMAKLKPDFDKRERQGHRPSASIRSTGTAAGPRTSRRRRATRPNFPMIGDPDAQGLEALRHAARRRRRHARRAARAADNQTVRTVFVIGPDKKIKLMIAYPMTTGRNFDEILRVVDSLQLTAKHKVSTPVNWKQGEDVIIAGSVSNEDAKKIWPQGWKEPKPYIRIVPQPK